MMDESTERNSMAPVRRIMLTENSILKNYSAQIILSDSRVYNDGLIVRFSFEPDLTLNYQQIILSRTLFNFEP